MHIDTHSSSLRFVYPFLTETDHFPLRVGAINQASWAGTKRPLTVWTQEDFPEEELLSHIADFLNPREGIPETAFLWSLSPEALQSSRGGLGGGESSNVNWTLYTPQGEVPFLFNKIELILFRIGVGFLSVSASPVGSDNRVEAWLDFMHYFRFARGQRGVQLQAIRQTGFNYASQKRQTAPFFPAPSGGSECHPEGIGVLDDLLCALLITGNLQGDESPWWRDVFVPGQMLPFVALYIDGIQDEEIPFLLYRARNFFHANQGIHPALDDLRLDHPMYLSHAYQQWFFFSLDGGGFVACNAPPTGFYRTGFPSRLQNEYFLLFFLTLQQRFALMMLIDQVAENWPIGYDPIRAEAEEVTGEANFERLRARLLSFTARGHFAQAMQQEHHHRCYRKWQETFQVERLYQEVSDEVRHMHDYLQSLRDRRLRAVEDIQRQQSENLNRKLNLIAWVFGVPAIILAYLDAIGPVKPIIAGFWLVGGLIAGLMIFLAVNHIARR